MPLVEGRALRPWASGRGDWELPSAFASGVAAALREWRTQRDYRCLVGATIARCVPSSCSPFWWSLWRSSRRRGPATRDGAGTCASIGCCDRMPGVSSARSPSGRAIRAVVGLGGWLQPMSATPSLTPLPLGVSAAGDARPGRSTIRCRGCGAASVSGASPSAMCFRAGERRPARAAVGDSLTEGPGLASPAGRNPSRGPAGLVGLAAFWPPARSAGAERLAARVESFAQGLGPCRPAAPPLSATAWVEKARRPGRWSWRWRAARGGAAS